MHLVEIFISLLSYLKTLGSLFTLLQSQAAQFENLIENII